MARARGDLALAKVALPAGGFYEDLCFHAQQAAEKAIKAVYRHCGLVFPYTHDLGELLAGLKAHGVEVPPVVEEAEVLSSYASEARYPGLSEPVGEEEHRRAVELAEGVVRWAARIIGVGSDPGGLSAAG
jgi:HEPN domain-containing protein